LAWRVLSLVVPGGQTSKGVRRIELRGICVAKHHQQGEPFDSERKNKQSDQDGGVGKLKLHKTHSLRERECAFWQIKWG